MVRFGWALVAVFGVVGCGSPEKAACDTLVECGAYADSEDCLSTLEADQEEIDEAGCGGEYDDALKCIGSNGTCGEEDGVIEGCDPEYDAFLVCALGG